MNITLIIGWVVSLALVVFGILQGGTFDMFIDIPSLAITLGGSLGVLIAMSPLSLLKTVPKLFKIAILPPKYDPKVHIRYC